jgi:hypothetical protein
MLHQNPLQLKRTDSIIGALENVVSATDEKEVAIAVQRCQISGVV